MATGICLLMCEGIEIESNNIHDWFDILNLHSMPLSLGCLVYGGMNHHVYISMASCFKSFPFNLLSH